MEHNMQTSGRLDPAMRDECLARSDEERRTIGEPPQECRQDGPSARQIADAILARLQTESRYGVRKT
jgi:hypothetical protein